MAKPLSKRIRKSLRTTVKSAEKRLDPLLPGNGTPTAAVAGMAIAGVAGVAGVAAAVRRIRKGRDQATSFHVRSNGDGWVVGIDGHDEPIGTFRTKRKAVQAARRSAAEAAPSRLVIYTADGAEQNSHSYELV